MSEERTCNVIRLEGRIDTNNAAEIEKMIDESIAAHPGEDVLFDATDLTYISSAGLRVLMKVKKKAGTEITILDVSPEVYDIFETTGFTDLFKVRKKLREISVEGCEQIGAGVSSKVYRIDQDSIVKVYHPEIGLDRIEEERENAKTAFVSGIPTAITYDIVKCDDSFGTVYELIDAEQLSVFLRNHPDKAPEYRAKYVNMLKEMHKIELPEKFQDIKALYIGWIDCLRSYYTEEEIDAFHRFVEAIPDRNTFVHCDAHVGNTLVQDGELILIDMADAGRGHPFFDIGMLCYHYQMVPNSPGRQFGLKTVLGFVPDTNEIVDTLWNDIIKGYFEPQNEKEFAMANGIARIAGGLQALVTPARQSQLDEKYKQMNVTALRKNFVPNIGEYTEAIKRMEGLF